MTHVIAKNTNPVQNTLMVMLLVGASFMAIPSEGFAKDNDPAPEMTFDGASDTFQDCLLTEGSTSSMDSDSVDCSVNGKTTECDLSKSGDDDQCVTTADRRGKRGTRRAETSGGKVVIQPGTKAGGEIIPILRTPVKRVMR